MLVKIKDGKALRFFHEGIRYIFAPNEVKDCPDSIIVGYRGLVLPAEPPKPVVVKVEIPKPVEKPKEAPKMTVVEIPKVKKDKKKNK